VLVVVVVDVCGFEVGEGLRRVYFVVILVCVSGR
jgi:hypothetical protein